MGIEMGVYLTFGGALILIFLLGRALLVPLKMILKLIANSLVGAVLLIVINFIGMNIGIMIPINVVNVLTVGILGVPGVITLLLICN
ncbi:pro-sigmaK processing inhibitor BofA family protein [Ihubacter sp. rT4E-8]|uniref:pro-sigmaK processing inhibitor BofA family protein n=1 Tax=unclassified Ihubacter TaxID=2633299 RepID=UPI001379AE44